MTELEKARHIINETDKAIAQLFETRMDAVSVIAEYKKTHGLPVYDPSREEELLHRSSELIKNDQYRSYYVSFLRETMEVSKGFQRRLMDGMRVAYSGVEGAFANIVAERIFPDAVSVPYADFAAAYKAVENGDCDCAVLPIENSTNGDVGRVLDLAYFGTLCINGVYEAEIIQNLLAVKGTTMDEIKTVISHPQALGQCADYIESHGYKTVEAVNTAVAAKQVAESGRHYIAAIASDEAAAKYGLKKLESHINKGGMNSTRFAVFSRIRREPSANDKRFIIMFTVKNAAGSLGKAINAIGENGYNLRAIKSRPTKDLIWDYYFYAEGEGNLSADAGQKMLAELSAVCNDLKIIGSYEKDVRI